MQKTTLSDNNIARMPLAELRQKWAECWGIQPHVRIGRLMLEKSLEFMLRGGFSTEQQVRLDHLIAGYRRNPKSFDQGAAGLKPGTKLIRTFRGERHAVLVKADGFEYRDKVYGSLSEVAYYKGQQTVSVLCESECSSVPRSSEGCHHAFASTRN